MRILIAVDESPHAREAVRWVQNANWPAGTAVRLLSSVRSDLYVTGELYAPAAAELEDLIEDDAKRVSKTLADRTAELTARGLTVDTSVARGDPRLTIVDEARAWHADLVVVGSHGRSGLSALFLGSVATHVVSHAPCSVLVIKLPKKA
jgi:nucleotide-binding universal stress UspA family protein